VLDIPDFVSDDLINITVADLLIPHLRVWNIGAIQNLASNIDTKHIFQTPVFESVQNDKRIWNFESNDIYSVKSG